MKTKAFKVQRATASKQRHEDKRRDKAKAARAGQRTQPGKRRRTRQQPLMNIQQSKALSLLAGLFLKSRFNMGTPEVVRHERKSA